MVENLPQPVEIVLITLLTGKVVQKFGEKNSTTDSSEQLSPENESSAPVSNTEGEVAQGNKSSTSSNEQAAKNGHQPAANVLENTVPSSS